MLTTGKNESLTNPCNGLSCDGREGEVSTGSQNNISVYRSLTRGDSAYRRGSNASLHDGGSGWSGSGSSGDRGDLRSLSMFSRSKSSSASNLGPSSLQLGGWRRMVVMRQPSACSQECEVAEVAMMMTTAPRCPARRLATRLVEVGCTRYQ